jgi:hypothetical protein
MLNFNPFFWRYLRLRLDLLATRAGGDLLTGGFLAGGGTLTVFLDGAVLVVVFLLGVGP